ncbi:hypothetical protein [Candidatus Laterigemmans baculatus]|uniref:hypothetical protein n=1 Tax=Candidatus Laterigemmans baculatus TaxID=2770505 RepID=UPI0013D943B5|nr:hypothetical protein [Candidatus Laterigemmans baculatus]
MVDANWIDAVAAYLKRLDLAVGALAAALDRFEALPALTGEGDPSEPAVATAEASAQLESLLEERAELLAGSRVEGRRGRSLRTVLEHCGEAELLQECERIAARIEEQRVRTISSFVTHFHLAEASKDLVRILTRSGSSPGTYAGPGAIRAQGYAGGGLLDEAA